MTTIEVDFDVFKALTTRRATEAHSHNDVLRDLLGLGTSPVSDAGFYVFGVGCVFRGVSFPEGSQFRATYKGKTYTAAIKGGRWIDESGAERSSPSDAAHAVTHTNVNGWRFWQCKRPNDTTWRLMEEVR